jgi:hypothetical protein
MTIYELLEEFSSLQFQYAVQPPGPVMAYLFDKRHEAKAALIAEIDRLVAKVEPIENIEQLGNVICPHCKTIIGHFDGDRLKIGGLNVESILGVCSCCGQYFYWSKFGRQE